MEKATTCIVINLSEDAFRLAEPVESGEGENAYKDWIKNLASLLERNQTDTEKRYNFHRREQAPGESVDSYMLCLWENRELNVAFEATNTPAGKLISLFSAWKLRPRKVNYFKIHLKTLSQLC